MVFQSYPNWNHSQQLKHKWLSALHKGKGKINTIMKDKISYSFKLYYRIAPETFKIRNDTKVEN
jgi:hypothetical protein